MDGKRNLYFTDASHSRIGRISATGPLSLVAGNNSNGFTDGTGEAAQFNNPFSITIDGKGNLFVTYDGNAAIRKITASGKVSTLWVTGNTSSPPSVGRPEGITIDANGNLFVTDVDQGAILKITPTEDPASSCRRRGDWLC